jgi:hypothetical protein
MRCNTNEEGKGMVEALYERCKALYERCKALYERCKALYERWESVPTHHLCPSFLVTSVLIASSSIHPSFIAHHPSIMASSPNTTSPEIDELNDDQLEQLQHNQQQLLEAFKASNDPMSAAGYVQLSGLDQTMLNHLTNPALALDMDEFTPSNQAFLTARPGTDLWTEEQAHVQQLQNVKCFDAQKRLLGDGLREAVKIGVAFSGGGLRAMIGTVAFLTALKDIGVLDTAAYVAALSGSSWAVGPWYTCTVDNNPFVSKAAQPDKDPWLGNTSNDAPMVQKLLDMCATDLPLVTAGNAFERQTARVLRHKFLRACHLDGSQSYGVNWSRRLISAPDVWGVILGSSLLRASNAKDFYEIGIGEQKVIDKMQTNAMPLPILTCIATEKCVDHWFEITPFSAGAEALRTFVPTASFGSGFYANKVVGGIRADDQLHYMMGICGSAFAANLNVIADSMPAGMLKDFVMWFLSKCPKSVSGSPVPLTPAYIPNFAPLSTATATATADGDATPFTGSTVALRDAGLAFNLPLPPLARRKVDVMIVCDMTLGVEDGPFELIKAAQYFDGNSGREFPHIAEESNANVKLRKYSHTGTTKAVLYMPAVGDAEFVSSEKLPTMQLHHAPEVTQRYFDIIYNNVVQSRNLIVAGIEEAARAVGKL